MAETQVNKTGRERLAERLKAKYPDREWADEEALMGQINDDYDQYDADLQDRDAQIEQYGKNEKAFSDLFTSDPRSAAFLMNWKDGRDPAIALMEMFGDDIIDAINDPEKMEEVAAAREDYLKRVAEQTQSEEQYKANLQQSLQDLEIWQQQRGMSDEQMDALMEKVIKMASDVVMGKIEPSTLDMISKAEGYDAAVADASMQGEVRGRNSKIEEKLRRPSQGDGTSQLAQGAVQPQQPQRRTPNIFQEAQLAQ